MNYTASNSAMYSSDGGIRVQDSLTVRDEPCDKPPVSEGDDPHTIVCIEMLEGNFGQSLEKV